MLKEFLDFVKQNKSRNTHKTYETLLTQFDGWLKTRKSSIDACRAEDATKFLIEKSEWNGSTGGVFLQTLKSYANYCLDYMSMDAITPEEVRDMLKEQQRLNQIKSLRYPSNLAVTKKPRQRILSLSIRDLEKFFSIADRYDKLVAYILLYFCVRKEELFETKDKVKYFKVDFKNMKATFRVKKRKGIVLKTLNFDNITKKVLGEYLQTPPPLNESSINKRFNKYDKQMGFRVYPHAMRHTSYGYLKKTLPPLYPNWEFLVDQIAGHTPQRKMEAIYTDPKLFEEEIREILVINHWLKQVKIKW